MEVIFVKDLRGQGKKGDIKDVKQGYGQNFLIKNGYAVLKTKENLKRLEKDQANKAKELEEEKQKAIKLKEQIEKLTIDFKVNVGEGDKVFGSISSKQIKEALQKENIKIAKSMIKKENVSSLGFHNIEIELFPNIIAKLKIHLIK